MGYYSCQALNIAGSVITKALLEVTDGEGAAPQNGQYTLQKERTCMHAFSMREGNLQNGGISKLPEKPSHSSMRAHPVRSQNASSFF